MRRTNAMKRLRTGILSLPEEDEHRASYTFSRRHPDYFANSRGFLEAAFRQSLEGPVIFRGELVQDVTVF